MISSGSCAVVSSSCLSRLTLREVILFDVGCRRSLSYSRIIVGFDECLSLSSLPSVASLVLNRGAFEESFRCLGFDVITSLSEEENPLALETEDV